MKTLIRTLSVKGQWLAFRVANLAWNESAHPRAPKGDSTGGQFVGGSGIPPSGVSERRSSESKVQRLEEDFSNSDAYKGNSRSGMWSDRTQGVGAIFKTNTEKQLAVQAARRALTSMGFEKGKSSFSEFDSGPDAFEESKQLFNHPSGVTATLTTTIKHWRGSQIRVNTAGKASLIFSSGK